MIVAEKDKPEQDTGAEERAAFDSIREGSAEARAQAREGLMSLAPAEEPSAGTEEPEAPDATPEEKPRESAPSEAEEPEEGHEESEGAEPEGESGSERGGSDSDWSPEAVKALRNLELKGIFSKSELDGLSSEEAVRRWKRISDDELQIRQLRQERAELQKRLEALEATPESEPTEGAVPTGAGDLSEAVQAFREEFGDEAGGVIETLVGTVKDLQSRLEGAERVSAQVTQERQQQVQKVLDETRSRLVAGVPQLSDPDTYDAVLGHMSQIAQLPKYASLSPNEKAEALMRDAADQLGIEVPAGEAPQSAPTKRRRQPVAASRKTSSGVPERPGDDRQIFDQIRARNRSR